METVSAQTANTWAVRRRSKFFLAGVLATALIGAPSAGASDPVELEVLVTARGSAASLTQPLPSTPER